MDRLLPYLGEHSVLFVGIGNVLKGDDGAGVYLTKLIRPCNHVQTLIVEMGIENHIGKINSLGADLTVLVDAADMNRMPGHIDFIALDTTTNLTSHTHNIALKNLGALLHMKTMVLGIQPAVLNLGKPLSHVVKKACESWAERLNKAAVAVS